MKRVEPEVRVIARTGVDYGGMLDYLEQAGGTEWEPQGIDGPEDLTEFAGRLCYRSWAPGLNPNVTKVRKDSRAYLENILSSRHGSVLEHASYSFVFHNVSRIFTHEMVRHRPGTAVSQESLRFVRLEEIPFWFPDWALEDEELMDAALGVLATLSNFQSWMTDHFGLDEDGVKMSEKKHKTSFMRRFAPEGVATGLVWTCNLRELRHVIEVRTSPAAEEEIRLVFGKVARIMITELPALFGDFTETDGSFVPRWGKV